MAKVMKAVVGEALGPPDAYALRSVPLPEPGEGEVQVRIEHASLGYADALIARGGYQVTPPLPYTPGTEVAGTVEAVGAGVAVVRPATV